MRPSFSVSLEPGLERGIPWGRDLFTFVTSAAGHMMRTLEKPRKSRPSKRQVNHRRFLHNMIQRTKGGKRKRQYAENSPRKFADIEAANHRLSSALYDKDEEKSTPALSEQESPPSERGSQQETDQYSVYTDLEGISESRSGASEEREEKQLDDKHLWTTRPQKSTCTAKMNNHNKMRQTKEKRGKKVTPSSYLNDQNDKDSSEEVELLLSENPNNNQIQMNPVNNISENNQRLPKHPSFILFAPNEYSSPPFSPELSPLSLDSCDFSAQMLSDLSGCTQETITDGLTDITELYRVSNQDSVGYMDVESYFERMCSCQVEAGSEVCPNEDTMVGNLTDDFTGSENVHEGECICSHENSCEEDREATADYFQSHLRSSQLPGQSEYPDTKQAYHGMEGTPISQEYSITELQTQEGNSCMLVNSLNLTPFEGVAQSFPVPPHHEHRPILTPPHEDDWLFPDIMKDRDPYYPYY